MGLNVSEWTNIAIAAATIIYTVGTFLLWMTTRKTALQNQEIIKLTEKQLTRQEQIRMVEYMATVHKNFRELYTNIISDDISLTILSQNLGNSNKQEIRKNYMASFLINHAYELFELRQNKMLPEDYWQRTEIDMRVLFQWPFVKERWKKIKSIYSNDFGKFLEEKIFIVDMN